MKQQIRKLVDQIFLKEDFFKIEDIPIKYHSPEYQLEFYADEEYRYEIDVYTHREETEEEYNKRLKVYENAREMARKYRFAEYLKLKAEFENGDKD